LSDLLNIELPFFFYGFFRPGEISFLGIEDYVLNAQPISIPGELVLRDGITLFKDSDTGYVDGYLISFKEDKITDAYSVINSLEPNKLFRWEIKKFNEVPFNILFGIKPDRGSDNINESEWKTIWGDPFFTSAIDVLREFKIEPFEWDLKPLFKLQMKYMLLWAIIERFTFLRYSFRAGPSEKNKMLAENPYFKEALHKYVTSTRELYSSEDPSEKYQLIKENPKKSIEYYYKVRCNISHRGKTVKRDYDTVNSSFSELFNVTTYILNKTKEECEMVKLKYS